MYNSLALFNKIFVSQHLSSWWHLRTRTRELLCWACAMSLQMLMSLRGHFCSNGITVSSYTLFRVGKRFLLLSTMRYSRPSLIWCSAIQQPHQLTGFFQEWISRPVLLPFHISVIRQFTFWHWYWFVGTNLPKYTKLYANIYTRQ